MKENKVVLLVLAIEEKRSSSTSGDIKSRATTSSYRDGWDNIFGKREGKELN